MSEDRDDKNIEIAIHVRAPNGAMEDLRVGTHEEIAKITHAAVAAFLKKHLIEDGPYDLALVRHGHAPVVLDPSKRLDQYEFDAIRDTFHLVTRAPQVDG
jgi:hypothetical protein